MAMFCNFVKYTWERKITSKSINCSTEFLKTFTSVDTKNQQLSAKEKYEAAMPYKHIPGPKSYPVIKSTPFLTTGLSRDPQDVIKNFSRIKQLYGPVARLDIPLKRPTVFIFEPTLIEKAVKDGVSIKPTRDGMRYLHVYRTQTRKEWYDRGAGLLTEQGEKWYRIRSKVQQPMMRPKTATLYLGPMNEVAQDFIEYIRRIRSKENNQVPDSFINDLYKWGLESVSLIALNTRMGCLSPDQTEDSDGQVMITSVNKAFEAMMALEMALPFWEFFPTKDWKKMANAMDKMSQIGFKYINKTAKELEKKEESELSVLEKFLTTPGLNKSDAYNMAMDMMFAGIDTTGNAMGYFLYHVAKYPKVQKKIQQEIDDVLPNKDKPLSPDDINRLSYLKSAIKESMRLFPVTSVFGRTVDQDIVVAGYQVPRGTNIVFVPHITSHDHQHFPDPNVFKPERWLRGHEEQHKAHAFAFLPFGYGVRMCIGKRIAEQELWVLSAKILRNYWVNYDGEEMKTHTRLVNVPGVPLRFQFIDRT